VPRHPVRVVAAALARGGAAGAELLIAQRPPGKWRAGCWEFPGGKIEADETGEAALLRELREELGVTARTLIPLGTFRHEYPERSVEILLWLVTAFDGEPAGLDGQALRWIAPAELTGCNLLEADLPMIGPLREALLAVTLPP
jgi:8-oxo-dGTP diphosphatase